MTVPTCVCCSMTSETQTRYGVRSSCQGRSLRPSDVVPVQQRRREVAIVARLQTSRAHDRRIAPGPAAVRDSRIVSSNRRSPMRLTSFAKRGSLRNAALSGAHACTRSQLCTHASRSRSRLWFMIVESHVELPQLQVRHQQFFLRRDLRIELAAARADHRGRLAGSASASTKSPILSLSSGGISSASAAGAAPRPSCPRRIATVASTPPCPLLRPSSVASWA